MVKGVVRALMVLIVLSGCAPVSGQAIEPHLIPVDPELAAFESLRPYKLAVREHLLGRAVGCSVLVFPSFEAEWAVQIARDRGRPFVLYAAMDAPRWGALQQRLEREGSPEAQVLQNLTVSVSRRTATLAQDTAQVVEKAWSARLSASRRPVVFRRIIDGTSHLFLDSGSGPGQRVGLARSPEAGTPSAALVVLVDALRHHVESAASAPTTSEAEVLGRAKDVLARLRVAAY